MTPYPYNFGDGKKDILTLEQVFFRLYSDYVKAKQAWAEKTVTKEKMNLQVNIQNLQLKRIKKRNNEFFGLV
ncbi:hypothetical protein OL548_20280 [Lysinibacillus sp. MHQ-1]|nr:hypothetical protein OL548_20280 [Lysinibacillus sp. MHQ-1]